MTKMSRFILASMLAACAIATVSGAGAGKAVYDHSCKGCHGPDGTASPAIEKMMKVQIKNLKSPAVQAMSDADLKKIITAGKGKMHPVRGLSATQVDDVVAYIRTLKK